MDKLGIITPHYNNIEGLKSIYSMLLEQVSDNWEWIIVDDNSINKNEVVLLFNNNSKVKVLSNDRNLGPSVSRNKGANQINTNKIVFLDSDDIITKNFVMNRLVNVSDIRVYGNMMITDELRLHEKRFSNITSDFLENLLKANFPWQTTAILWNREFFVGLGLFDTSLKLLEDIELSIRALLYSEEGLIFIDNEIDFYYVSKPINSVSRPFLLVRESVEKIVKKVTPLITDLQKKNLVNYYYLSTRYFIKDSKSKIKDLQCHLFFFHKNKIINRKTFFLGMIILLLYPFQSKTFFLRLNRKIFKTV